MIGIHSYRKFSVHTTFFKVFNYLIGNLFVEQIFKFYLKQKKNTCEKRVCSRKRFERAFLPIV